MFKQGTAADELAEAMRRLVLNSQAEEQTHANKLSDAVDCLDNAAALFDELNMSKASETICQIIEKIAQENK